MVDRVGDSIPVEPHFDGQLRFFGGPYVRDLVIRMSPRGRFFDLIFRQSFAGYSHRQGRLREQLVQFDAEHQDAARQADQNQIKPESDAAPEMNLEKRSPRPDTLRTPPQTF